MGSSTESGLNDMFVAAPYSSSATNATFKGSYWLADMDFPSGTAALSARSYMFQLNPDGAGNLEEY